MKDLPVLTVPGRRAASRAAPRCRCWSYEGQRYLLEGFPGADWARNVRAAGGAATLTTGKRH